MKLVMFGHPCTNGDQMLLRNLQSDYPTSVSCYFFISRTNAVWQQLFGIMFSESSEEETKKSMISIRIHSKSVLQKWKLLTISWRLVQPDPVIALCCCGHLLASTSSLASLSIRLFLSLCVRISLSLRFISLCHRSCSRGALSSITLCITDDALATTCFNAAGLLFVDSTDSTIHGGKGATGRTTACSKSNI